MKQSISLYTQRITYYEFGHRHNTSIVFLHGLGSTSYSFYEIATILKDEYHVIAIDLPGHGETDNPPDGSFQLDDLAHWLHKILLKLDITNNHIVGHSWGGYIALMYASLYETTSVILLDGGYINASLIPGATLEEELEGATTHIQNHQFNLIEDFVASVNDDTPSFTVEAQKRSLYYDGSKARLIVSESTAHSIIAANFEQPSQELIANVHAPVLLLRSTIPEEMNPIRKSATDRLNNELSLKVHDIKASHDLYLEQPNTVSTILINWLKETEEDNDA